MIKQFQQAFLETIVSIRKGPKGMNKEKAMSMNSLTISLYARRLGGTSQQNGLTALLLALQPCLS